MLLVALVVQALGRAADLPLSVFDTGTYGNWSQSGDAFRLGPASGPKLVELEIRNNRDRAVASSELEGDRPTGTLTSPEFQIARRHIAFRIGGGDMAGQTCINLIVKGRVVRTAAGHRSDVLAPTDWDVKEFRGAKARIEIVDRATGDWGHVNIDHLVQTDRPEMSDFDRPLYQEPLRPLVHVTARYWKERRLNPVEHQEGWINDLNGLIYYDGEYHLFAQRWATCWLHFVSKDLVHWEELEPAFFEESLGSGVQSGTCVIDENNTSGLGKDGHVPMIAFWSRFDNKSQCFSYSLDHGRSWKPGPKNPFLLKAERDPKVFWYGPGGHWVMVMYGEGSYHVLNSSNLTDWTDTGHPIPDSFECPDMFELPVEGEPGTKKWIVVQGNGHYSVGTFDGKRFVQEGERQVCDIGPNFYATQTWANTETGDGRRIQAAWMRGSVFPNMPFSQQVSFPCRLTLHRTSEGFRLHREPIKELSLLHGRSKSAGPVTLEPGRPHKLAAKGEAFRLVLDVSLDRGARLEFDVRGQKVTVSDDGVTNGTAEGRVARPVRHLELLIDRGSIELFVNHGELSSTRYALFDGEGITVSVLGGRANVKSAQVTALKAIWR
ncbi:MAG: glycoside hydrolase family 32 protein [Armatimonadetes bacterium]|nr:glycoside hydrolase family 32 protein [Armatimonadota bacterium]